MQNSFLFVYGTLLRGAVSPIHEDFQRETRFVSKGTVPGRLYEIDGYPGLLPPASDEDRVKGEIYLLKNTVRLLALLDRYEGCVPGIPEPHEYRRERISVAQESGETLTAWAYLYQLTVSSQKRIQSGDYLDSIKRLKAK